MQPPRPGTLAFFRLVYDSRYRRGALVHVGDAKAWIARALPDGRVSVYRIDGPSFAVSPSEVWFA